MIGTPEQLAKYLFALDKDKFYEIKEFKETRGNDANAYAWVLMQKIADKIDSTKIEVYHEAIRNKGQFVIVPLKDQAVGMFIREWNKKGIGWLCEILGPSKIEGYTNIIAYYGTSCYTTETMSSFIDYLVDECKTLKIETMPLKELEALKNAW